MTAPDPPRRRRFHPPAVVWAITLLGFLLSVSASLVLPTYLGFDEPQHVDMVAAVAWGDGWAAPGHRNLSQAVARSSNQYYGSRLRTRPLDLALKDLPGRGERQTFAELGGDASAGGTPNQISQHPPVYYALEAVVLKALGADHWSYDRLVELLRLVSALIVAPLPLLVWAMAVRLRAGPGVAVAASALAIALPGLARVAGMVNNDDFLILTTTGLLLGLVHVATGDLTRRTAIVVGLLTGLALLSKGFALPLPLLVVLAYVLAVRKQSPARGVAPLAWALGVGFVSGGLWWVRNLLLYGTLQPEGYGAVAFARIKGPKRPPGSHADLGVFLDAAWNRMTRTFWGGGAPQGHATMEVALATVLTLILLLSVLVGVALGLRGQARRGTLVLLLLPLPLTLGIVLSGAYSSFATYGSLPGLQGRYLYLAVSGLALTTAVAWDRLLGSARRVLPLLAVGVVLLLQGLQGRAILRQLWEGPGQGGLRRAFRGLEVVSPWSTAATRLVFAATALVALIALVLAARGAFAPLRRPAAREPVAAL